jgi:ABC-type branched-subunit amino acid transport system substrate-binding protein
MAGAFIIILLSLSISSTINAAEPIVIAVMDPMSGPFKDAGFMTTTLSEYVVDQLNAKGGILGRPIKLLKYDTQMKPDVAVRQAKKAILEDGAKFILHHTSSAIALALSKLAQENNVIYVNLGAAADKATGEEFTPNMFRTCLSTTMHSGILAQYFAQTPYKKYYLLNMDYVFGHEAADAFKKVFKKIKPEVEIVGDEYHPIGTKDFGPYVSKILATKAEVVFTSNFEADLTNLIKQARTLGMNAIIGSYYLNATPVMNSLREAAIGCVTAEAYMETVETKKNQEFLETWQPWYKKHYPGEPSFYLIPGKPGGTVNGFYFLAEAIKKAGSIDADKVIKAWEGMSFDGLCGKVTMRACDHQIQTPAFVAKIEANHPFRKIIDFPYIGKPTLIPAEKISVPPGETGNPRCK